MADTGRASGAWCARARSGSCAKSTGPRLPRPGRCGVDRYRCMALLWNRAVDQRPPPSCRGGRGCRQSRTCLLVHRTAPYTPGSRTTNRCSPRRPLTALASRFDCAPGFCTRAASGRPPTTGLCTSRRRLRSVCGPTEYTPICKAPRCHQSPSGSSCSPRPTPALGSSRSSSVHGDRLSAGTSTPRSELGSSR